MMTSTTVSYAYAFVDGMPGSSQSKGARGEGNDPQRKAQRTGCSIGCGSGCGAAASPRCCGGGFCGAMRGALTYVGLGQIQLGRAAEQHLFAAKVT